MKYPVRCVIIDVNGGDIGLSEFGIVAKTPLQSKPHIGKHGLAETSDGWNVKITLDDGNILYGYECWWTTEEDWEKANQEK